MYLRIRLCLLACTRAYPLLLDVCMYNATYFSHVMMNLTNAQVIPRGKLNQQLPAQGLYDLSALCLQKALGSLQGAA